MPDKTGESRRKALRHLLSGFGAVGAAAVLSRDWVPPSVASSLITADETTQAAAKRTQLAMGGGGGMGGGMGGGGMGGGML